MQNLEISTAEMISVLTAMATAADTYEAESNRTPLADIERALRARAKQTRAIASALRNRALENSDFADAGMNAALRDSLAS